MNDTLKAAWQRLTASSGVLAHEAVVAFGDELGKVLGDLTARLESAEAKLAPPKPAA